VTTASVGCGVMGVGGNKGGVAVSFSLFRRRIIVVCSHFAAHQEAVEARNADYAKIVRNMHFANTSGAGKGQQAAEEGFEVGTWALCVGLGVVCPVRAIQACAGPPAHHFLQCAEHVQWHPSVALSRDEPGVHERQP
jgi:hypothetical protein